MSSGPFHYCINGLSVASDFEIQEAWPGVEHEAEVEIRRAALPAVADPERRFRKYEITPAGDLLEYEGMGRFRVKSSTLIEFDPEACFDLRRLGLPLLGPVLALLLHRRGHYVLHGSAIEIGGEAHVFLGDKGAGKSTTAATLVAAGYPLIADDVVAVERTPEGLAVHAGYPAMKLDRAMRERFPPGSCRILQPDDGGYTAGKSRIRLAQRSPAGPTPLGPVHVLARGSEHGVTPYDNRDTLQALIRFSYYPRFGGEALSAAETASLFSMAATIAPLARTGRLTVKNELQAITSIAPILENLSVHQRAPG